MATKKSAASPASVGMDEDYRAESDLRTLIEAEKIKGDKGRLKAALAKGAEMRKDLDKVKG